MSEERTQIFRGDEAPEMAIADTTPTERKKPLSAPVDQRGLHDQKDGASFDRSIHDAAGGPSDQRQLHDADGLSDLRQLHGKEGGDGAPRLTDGDGPTDPRHLHDASHGGGSTTMRDGDGPSDQRQMDDGDGLSDQRQMRDAEGLSDQRHMEDADGLSDRREMRDHRALVPGQLDTDADRQTNDLGATSPDAVAESDAASANDVVSDPDLTFTVEDDATPWALSIHLEERIASLGVSTTKVNRQLDKLEDSIERLAKRIAR